MGGKGVVLSTCRYAKASNMVRREGVGYKLVKETVKGKHLNVVMGMYRNIKSCVMFSQEFSKTFVCNLGVRQGRTCLQNYLLIMSTI